MTRGAWWRTPRRLVAAAALSLLGSSAAAAQPPEIPAAAAIDPVAAPEPGSEYRIYLLTIGPGPVVWQRFGHNALWISDTRTGREIAFNWGMFDFAQPNFLGRFLTGDTRYWLEGFDAPALVRHYAQVENRSVWRQELALTPAQRARLVELVTVNAREENKYYRYDYYLDNCSTRVRDVLDQVLGGAIRQATDTVATGTSYRWHTRRLLAAIPAAYAGIQIALGRPADREISAWEESFLPVRLMTHVRRIRVTGSSGETRPLVAGEETLFAAPGGAEPASPPFAAGSALAIGVGLAVAVALLGRAAADAARRGVRSGASTGLAVVGGGWMLVTGVVGVVLLLAGTMTPHVFWGRNLNLAVVNPLALVSFVLLAAALVARAPEARLRWSGRAAAAAGVLAALSAVGAVLMLVPGIAQRSWDVFAGALPVNLALWWAVRGVARGAGVPRTSGAT